MRIKIFQIFLIIIFLVIFFIFYIGLKKTNIYVPETNFEKNIPDFKVKIFNSEKFIETDEIFKDDKFYLINIWASWCIPCRDEHVFLMKLSEKNNLEIIGINYKDKNSNAENFLKALGNPFKIILSDRNGTFSIEWGAYGVPESFLVYDKKIIKKVVGPIDKDLIIEIERLIQ